MLHVLGRNDDLRDRVRGLGSKTWKECECVELIGPVTSQEVKYAIPDLLEGISVKKSIKDGSVSNQCGKEKDRVVCKY